MQGFLDNLIRNAGHDPATWPWTQFVYLAAMGAAAFIVAEYLGVSTGISGGDLPRSILATAILSFAVAAGVAWFLIGKRRSATAIDRRPPEDSESASAQLAVVKKPVRQGLPPITMARWRK